MPFVSLVIAGALSVCLLLPQSSYPVPSFPRNYKTSYVTCHNENPELDITDFPWLLPGIRYETGDSDMLNPMGGGTLNYTDRQSVPGVVVLLRANVKLDIPTDIDGMESQGDSVWNQERL